MKNKTLTYLALSLLCCICACTSVDLCPEAGHPHITDMRVRLNWGDISKDEIPAEMHIVASRIINTWRTRGIINTSMDRTAESVFGTFHKIASATAMCMDVYTAGQYIHSFYINQLCTDNGEVAIGYF